MNFVLFTFCISVCSITKIIMLSFYIYKKLKNLKESICKVDCIYHFSHFWNEGGESDIIFMWWFFIFTCFLILLIKDIFIKCLYTLQTNKCILSKTIQWYKIILTILRVHTSGLRWICSWPPAPLLLQDTDNSCTYALSLYSKHFLKSENMDWDMCWVL